MGFMTLLCYLTVLAAIVLSVYSLMTLSLRDIRQQIVSISSLHGF